MFAPPYLTYSDFHQPVITGATESADLGGADFVVRSRITNNTQNHHSIDKVVLLRPAGVTHSFDASQRYIELYFSNYTVDPQDPHNVSFSVSPPTDDLGPQGWYMLFIVEKETTGGRRVPSVGHFMYLQ